MGYYTHYTLETDSINHHTLVNALRDECESAGYLLDTDGNASDTGKWYEHEDDIRKFSEGHPLVLFTLSGEGEEAGDIWKKYFKDGKCQVAKAEITFPRFDERLLR